MAVGFDKALGIHPHALALRAERANHLANNLANAETPNYQAKDFDFVTTLQHLQANAAQSPHVTAQEEPSSSVSMDAIVEQHLQYRLPTQSSVDGNTVDENHENAEFMRNALGYQTSFTLLNGRFKGLMTAIRGE